MQSLDMAERREAREAVNPPRQSREPVRESPANASVVRLWDLGRILGPKPSLFWIDGTRQNKNGFISKLVKPDMCFCEH